MVLGTVLRTDLRTDLRTIFDFNFLLLRRLSVNLGTVPTVPKFFLLHPTSWSERQSHKERIITLAFAIRLKTLGEVDKLRAFCDAASVRLPLAPSGGEHVS